jgi:hypothetical protein
MPGENVIVGFVSQVGSPDLFGFGPDPSNTIVRFQDGRVARLNSDDSRSKLFGDILVELQQKPIDVYLALDERDLITDLLIPVSGKVVALGPGVRCVEVQIEGSFGAHHLSSANPKFREWLEILGRGLAEGFPVTVTDSDPDHEIIHVQPSQNPTRAEEFLQEQLEEFVEGGHFPAPQPVSPERAAELFDLVSARSCNPVTIPDPCIPFLWPDDGCNARSQAMCRLMIADGAEPAQVWIFSGSTVRPTLRPQTPNNPHCTVEFFLHVAPTLQVATAAGIETQVIDPAFLDAPMAVSQWQALMNDAHAFTIPTGIEVYVCDRDGSTADLASPQKTETDLASWHKRLRLRSARRKGPPPYIACQENFFVAKKT